MNPVRKAVTLLPLILGSAVVHADPKTRLPLFFEPNHGQHDAAILFSSRMGSGRLSLSREEAVFWDGGQAALRMRFVGSSADARVAGTDALPGRANYFIGPDPARWRTEIPTYARVRYEHIYPGIDLVFYGSPEGRLEYDFVVAPGADPAAIRMQVDAPAGVRVTADGRLIAMTAAGEVQHQPPVVYQAGANGRREIVGRYRFKDGTLGFEVGEYDTTRALVIDPVVVFASYLGGAAGDEGRGISLDPQGNIYLTGTTLSANFPVQNPLQAARSGTVSDVFVTKVSADGATLLYSTYLGGTTGDSGRSIAVDASGAAYIGGNAGTGFPVTAGAFQTQSSQNGDAFLAKLNPAGSALVYATYLAGSRGDQVTAVAIDDAGNLYATGDTASDNFPTTAGSRQPTRPRIANTTDAFVVKLNPTGTALVYSTLLGGTDEDQGRGIAVKSGSAYVTGGTSSPDFPVTTGVAQGTLGGTVDAFVVKVNPSGSAYDFATYLGGTNVDEGWGIALDVANDVYIAGTTLATDFPTTAGAFQTQRKTNVDGFAAKLNSTGSTRLYSTYIGSGAGDHLNSVAVDLHGAAYIVGLSQSDYPVTAQALQAAPAGGIDLVLTKVGFGGNRLLYSSFLGGSGADRTGQDSGDGGGGTITQRNCMAYITGRTTSTNFPVTAALQALPGGGEDALFAKIDPTTDLGEPQIDCAAGFLSTLNPLVDKWAPRSIGTLFGKNFANTTVASPAVDPATGLILTNLGNTCVEIDGRRAPVYFVNGTQLNFQVPVQTRLGWVLVYVIRGCGTSGEVRSEPLYILIDAVIPGFFIFGSTAGGQAIAAVNDTEFAATGNVVLVGPSSLNAAFSPAKAGDIVSAYFTGGGGTNPALGTGQIPGAVFPVSSPFSATMGGVTIPPGDIFYVGASPCCAGLDQFTFRIPSSLTTGSHQVVLTIGGVSSQDGPFIPVR